MTAPLATLARDPDPSIRMRVAVATGNADLALLARDTDVDVRRAAAALIAERTDAPTDVVVALIHDPDDAVRRTAATSLARAHLDETVLVSLLDDPDPMVADAAIDALTALRRRPPAHASENEHARRPLAHGMTWRSCNVSASPRTRRAPSSSTSSAARAGAGAACRRRGARARWSRASRPRARWLESPSHDTRASAVELLETQGGELLRPLLPLWENTSQQESTADDVLNALSASDPDELVRDAARRAISGGDSVETMPTISMMERVLFLRRVSLFGTLSPGDLKQLASLAHRSFTRTVPCSRAKATPATGST